MLYVRRGWTIQYLRSGMTCLRASGYRLVEKLIRHIFLWESTVDHLSSTVTPAYCSVKGNH